MCTRQDAFVAGGVLAVLISAVPIHAAWVVHEIPLLPHWTGGAEARDINSNGVVCGYGNQVLNTSSSPFRYDGTTVTELPLLPDADAPIGLATGINASGVVCGYSHKANGNSEAVIWIGTAITPLPYPPGANTNSDLRAYDINDSDVVVGYGWSTAGEHLAFYYRNGTSYSLDPYIRAAGLASPQFAYGVNNRNVVCGTADDASGFSVGWTYYIDHDTFAVIGRIAPDNCSAVDINNARQTIGRGRIALGGTYLAVTFDGAWHVVDETPPGSQWGEAINARGRKVGNVGINDARLSWYSDGYGNGSMVLLDLPGWTRETAQGINDRDQLVGYGRTDTSGTATRAFILRPPPGDGDHDGEVDLDDHAFFVDCLGGPNEAPLPTRPGRSVADCLHDFDLDMDADVDQADFAAFARLLAS